MAKTKVYVLYHGGCPDGYASAYAAWKHYGDDAEYIPCYYGYPPPKLKQNSDVYFIDFSYSEHEMENLRKHARTFKVIDHHKSNRWLADRDYATFDLDHSGAYLAWKEFVSDNVPWAILYVEDRDLGRIWQGGSKLHFSPEITSGLSSYRTETFEEYDELVMSLEHDMNVDYGYDEEAQVMSTRLYQEGEAILRFQNILVEEAVEFSQLQTFTITPVKANEPNRYYEGVPVMPAAILHSDIGNRLLKKHPDAPFSVTYRDNVDNIRSYSLRSTDDRMDVSVICKLAGGGGHHNAGGFEVDLNG